MYEEKNDEGKRKKSVISFARFLGRFTGLEDEENEGFSLQAIRQSRLQGAYMTNSIQEYLEIVKFKNNEEKQNYIDNCKRSQEDFIHRAQFTIPEENFEKLIDKGGLFMGDYFTPKAFEHGIIGGGEVHLFIQSCKEDNRQPQSFICSYKEIPKEERRNIYGLSYINMLAYTKATEDKEFFATTTELFIESFRQSNNKFYIEDIVTSIQKADYIFDDLPHLKLEKFFAIEHEEYEKIARIDKQIADCYLE